MAAATLTAAWGCGTLGTEAYDESVAGAEAACGGACDICGFDSIQVLTSSSHGADGDHIRASDPSECESVGGENAIGGNGPTRISADSTSHAEAEEGCISADAPHMGAKEWSALECAACMADECTDSSAALDEKWSAV
jgi:hypothetical protein